MMVAILIIVVVLVAWSLYLMQAAIEQREFSLMLAGTLVAMAAAAMVGVYFLMDHYMVYVSSAQHYVVSGDEFLETSAWWLEPQESGETLSITRWH